MMEWSPFNLKQMEQTALEKLEQLPLVNVYAKTRGWPFILSWVHRGTGVLLIVYLCFHVYTLIALKNPSVFNAKMIFFQSFFFVFLEWALAIPVVFHAFNGGRLLLYEVFHQRNDAVLIRWMLSLSFVYIVFMGLFMVMGNQSASPVLFWLCMLTTGMALSGLVASKIWPTGNSVAWKLQRISGGFLLVMIPAHFLFMHLQPAVGHNADVVIARMQHLFIKIIDLLLLFGGLYHGGYGLLSIVNDYIPVRTLRYACTVLIVIIMGTFVWTGMKLTLLI